MAERAGNICKRYCGRILHFKAANSNLHLCMEANPPNESARRGRHVLAENWWWQMRMNNEVDRFVPLFWNTEFTRPQLNSHVIDVASAVHVHFHYPIRPLSSARSTLKCKEVSQFCETNYSISIQYIIHTFNQRNWYFKKRKRKKAVTVISEQQQNFTMLLLQLSDCMCVGAIESIHLQ